MRIVPSVVVYQCGSIGHASNLVAIIPPRHDSGVVSSVLPEPVIGFTEIVQDVTTPNLDRKKILFVFIRWIFLRWQTDEKKVHLALKARQRMHINFHNF